MIRFIDLNNGNVFDGSQPYTFWFDDGQSVNINYVRKICFVSTEPTHTISLDSEVFELLDLSTVADHTCATEVFDQQEYYSLDPVETGGVTVPGLRLPQGQHSITVSGMAYQDMFVYMIYILANSDIAGEVVDTFYIDDTPYNIGADFYNEDERLSIDLGNFGVDIPYEVQKAVYDGNVHEDLRDNIMINRKFKELLLQYFDIVANKGNYKSLIESLQWFEYGDLLELREFWNESKTPYYYYERLDRIAGNDFLVKISEMIKKTYIGVYLGLKKLKLDGNEIVYDNRYSYVWHNDNPDIQWATLKQLDGDPIAVLNDPYNRAHDRLLQIGDTVNVDEYTDTPVDAVGSNWYLMQQQYNSEASQILNELNPVIEDISAKCTVTDLALKMTMLGNFYSTYFMPIHLDLIHSTVEAMVYTACTKILHTTYACRWDTYGHFLPIAVDVHTNEYLEPVKNLFVYKDTLFKQSIPGDANYDGRTYFDDYIGIDDPHENDAHDEYQYRHNTFLKYGGIGCRVDYKCRLKSYDMITRERIIIENENIPFLRIRDSFNTYTPDDNNTVDIDFSILLLTSGRTRVSFMFWTANGNTYVYTHELNVKPDARRGIYVCKVKRRRRPYMIDLDNIGFSIDEVGNYMFGQYPVPYDDTYMYSQVVSGRPAGVGLNHIVSFRFHSGVENHLIYEGALLDTSSCSTATELVDYLNIHAPKYAWYLTSVEYAPPEFIPPDGSELHVLGISKHFIEYDDAAPMHINLQHLQTVYTNRFICELRFLGIMHTFEPTEEYAFSSDEVLSIMPAFGEHITKPITEAVWQFKNVSTGEVFESKQDEYNGDVMMPFAGHYEQQAPLSRGYYDVTLRYRYSGDTSDRVLVHRRLFRID